MTRRARPMWFAWLALPLACLADEKGTESPALALRVTSIDNLFADLRYFSSRSDTESQKDERQFKEFLGNKNAGIDLKRPAGLFVWLGAAPWELDALLALPSAGQQPFLEFIERQGFKPQKEDNGVYRINSFNNLYIWFAHDYVYVGTKEKMQAAWQQPGRLFKTRYPGTVVFTLDWTRVPEKWAGLLMPAPVLRGILGEETELQRKLRDKVESSVRSWSELVARQGSEMVWQLGVDRKADVGFTDFTLAGRRNTALAQQFTTLGETPSRFAGLAQVPSASHLLVHWQLPEDLSDALRPVIDDSLRRLLQNAASETVRKHSVNVVEALNPTLRAGEIDAGFSLRGPSKEGRYTLVLGMKLREGNRLDAALRGLIRALPARDQDKFKFTVTRVQSSAVHRADLGYDLPEQVQKVFGNQPLHYCIIHDAVWLGLGPESLEALKQGIALPVQMGPPLSLVASVPQLVPLLVKEDKDLPAVLAASADVFGKANGNGKFRVSITGGEALKARVELPGPVVQFQRRARGKVYDLGWWGWFY